MINLGLDLLEEINTIRMSNSSGFAKLLWSETVQFLGYFIFC